MAAETDENLDNVISDLIDGDDEEEASQGSPLADIEAPDIDFSGPAVSLTERAARQIQKIRADEELDEELYLRVAVEGGGCSGLSYKLGFDHKSGEDEVIVSQGIEIIVDSRHMMYLKGISVDYPDGLDARGFTFDNPNATETCGCGSSFAT
ncbi:HesB/IscA family protein [Fodinibius sediminis]|uniref:Iron-sulfur cluster assembly protein n=1 Tax=Fodinibius sediminis TaxID=1214077 RepID=A0A521AJI1_9BACT|nr:iron-sulfur cluster assembly accessory protein [Fodinibius sediminis]SMO34995.1 iron-sulfur cluster assembly protein [Fodinibius sediminis]